MGTPLSGNRIWTEGDTGYLEITSRKFGVFVSKFDAHRVDEIRGRQWHIWRYPRKSGNGALVYASTQNARMHTLLFPDCPEGLVRDHINGDGLDNRASNIRFVTQAHNTLNRARKYPPGVFTRRGRNTFWAHVSLGSFATEEEATKAWREAYEKIHGDLPDCVAQA